MFVKRARAADHRRVIISQDADWPTGLRAAGRGVATGTYQGEVLNFQSAADLQKLLTAKRLELLRLAQGRGAIGVRELARLAGRDVKRVHGDLNVLAGLQLLERTESGGVLCPFETVHVGASAAPQIAAAADPASSNKGENS